MINQENRQTHTPPNSMGEDAGSSATDRMGFFNKTKPTWQASLNANLNAKLNWPDIIRGTRTGLMIGFIAFGAYAIAAPLIARPNPNADAELADIAKEANLSNTTIGRGGIAQAAAVQDNSLVSMAAASIDTSESHGVGTTEDNSEHGPDIYQAILKSGDRLEPLLMDMGASRDDARAAIRALATRTDLRRLQIGDRIEAAFRPEVSAGSQTSDQTSDKAAPALSFSDLIGESITGPFPHARPEGFKGEPAGSLLKVALARGPEQQIVAERNTSNRFEARLDLLPTRTQIIRASGDIDNSLYQAMAREGLPHATISEFVRIFSFDVDFQREIWPGSRFDIAFEYVTTEDGTPVSAGKVLVGSLTVRGKSHELYRFDPGEGGKIGYYDVHGKSSRRLLMRTPVDGARLSSHFGMRRHPVLGYNKMHKGADFAAPAGTPIMAAGDGVIEMAQWNGGYGRYVRIRHTSEYSTAYAHMKGYGPGIKKGRRVRQGQVIGYIGTSGRSTGPHLHYEVLRYRKQVNPLSIKLPTGQILAGSDLKSFQQQRVAIDFARSSAIALADLERPVSDQVATAE